jgi:hypothetical protein
LGVLITLLKMYLGRALLRLWIFKEETNTQTLMWSMFHTDLTRIKNHVYV